MVDPRSLIVVLSLLTTSSAGAQLLRPRGFEAALERADALMASDPERALDAAEEAAEVPGADGRAFAIAARASLALGRLDDANASVQSAILRMLRQRPPDGSVLAAAWRTLASIAERRDEKVRALMAHRRALEEQYSASAAREWRRLARVLARRDGSPPDTHGALFRMEGISIEPSACVLSRVPVGMHRVSPIDDRGELVCVELMSWTALGIRWSLVGHGDLEVVDVFLLAERGADTYVLGTVANSWYALERTSYAQPGARHVGDLRVGMELTTVFEAHEVFGGVDACDSYRHEHFDTFVCTVRRGRPGCLRIRRRDASVYGPGITFMLDGPREQLEHCGAWIERKLYPADRTPWNAHRHSPRADFEVRVGPRGVRAIGRLAPPSLRRWRSLEDLERWARRVPPEWQVAGELLKEFSRDPPDPRPEPAVLLSLDHYVSPPRAAPRGQP